MTVLYLNLGRIIQLPGPVSYHSLRVLKFVIGIQSARSIIKPGHIYLTLEAQIYINM